MGKIIFLNGCSSAGKTSLVKAIQHLAEEPWLNFGVDVFFKAFPAKYLPFGQKADEGIQFVPGVDQEGFSIMEVKGGSYNDKVSRLIPKVIKLLADGGLDLIIDEVVQEKEVLENWNLTLKNHQVYFVKVFCELSTMEERELIRGDRSIGLARAQYTKIEKLAWNYDLKIDTSKIGPLANAKKILEFVGERK